MFYFVVLYSSTFSGTYVLLHVALLFSSALMFYFELLFYFVLSNEVLDTMTTLFQTRNTPTPRRRDPPTPADSEQPQPGATIRDNGILFPPIRSLPPPAPLLLWMMGAGNGRRAAGNGVVGVVVRCV